MHNYKLIATFTYPSELVVARSVLEAHDVDCYVRDEITVQVHNFLSNAVGGIRLEVPTAKVEEARSILMSSGYGEFLLKADNEKGDKQQFHEFLKVAIYIALVVGVIFIITTAIQVYG